MHECQCACAACAAHLPELCLSSAHRSAAHAASPAILARRRLQAEAGLQDAGAAIVNGQDAQPGRHPYMASLRQRIDGQKSWHFCGATLVHERVLLTAAHW